MIMNIDKVVCGYGDKVVVNGFSAEIQQGEIFCLLGPNGIGKTTLFKAVLGFIPIKSGGITIDGKDISALSRKEFAKLAAYVPQAHTPPFSFNVLDVVTMGRTVHLGAWGRPTDTDREIAYQCLKDLEIDILADRIYTHLSGGERQMVLIARALAQQPAFLMMDEPTSNLDFGNQVTVLETVRRLADNGLGIVMTTHFPNHVFQLNANVGLMQKGFKYYEGCADEILTEENLAKTYNVDIAVIHGNHQGLDYNFCQPMIKVSAP